MVQGIVVRKESGLLPGLTTTGIVNRHVRRGNIEWYLKENDDKNNVFYFNYYDLWMTTYCLKMSTSVRRSYIEKGEKNAYSIYILYTSILLDL